MSAGPPTIDNVTANRDELIHLIAGLPDDRVDALLADARRLTAHKPKGSWPPAFFGAGVSKGGSTDIARNIDKHLAGGFGRPRP